MKKISNLIKHSNNPKNTWFNYFATLLNEASQIALDPRGGIVDYAVKFLNNQKDLKRSEMQKKIDEHSEKFKDLDYISPKMNYLKNKTCGYVMDECKRTKNYVNCKKKEEPSLFVSSAWPIRCPTNGKKQSICACFDVEEHDKVKKMELINKGYEIQKEYDKIGNNFIDGAQIAKYIGTIYGLFKGHKKFIEELKKTPIESKMDNWQDYFIVSLDNKPLPLTRDGNYADFNTIEENIQPCILFGTDNNTIIIRGINDNATKLKQILNLDTYDDPAFINDNNLKLLIYTSILPTISIEKNPEFYLLILNRIEETRRLAENRIVNYIPNEQLQVIHDLDNKQLCNIF